MRKKSHILLARCLADNFILNNIEDADLQYHRAAFCMGAILPDCEPSFLTEKHAYDVNFEKLVKKMRELTTWCNLDERKAGAYWIKAGEVTHYVADYFTFPHNTNFPGGIAQHCRYEEELKINLKKCILCGNADGYCKASENFKDCEEIVAYIRASHEQYMKKSSDVSEDIEYIISTSYQVLAGLAALLDQKIKRESPDVRINKA